MAKTLGVARKRVMRGALLFCVLSMAASVAMSQSPGYIVIVHPDNPATSISRENLSKFFLKKRIRWRRSGGVEISPVDQVERSSVRDAFTRDVHGRSVASIKNYWQRQIFSGSNVPPPEVESDAQVLAHVKSTPGGIGYVSPSARLSGVKKLAVTN